MKFPTLNLQNECSSCSITLHNFTKSQVNQQDVNFVAQFLKENFTEEMDGTQSGFKLEKVGQVTMICDVL